MGSEEQDRRCEDADGDDVDRAREDKEERGAASRHELADEAQPSDLGELPAARLEADVDAGGKGDEDAQQQRHEHEDVLLLLLDALRPRRAHLGRPLVGLVRDDDGHLDPEGHPQEEQRELRPPRRRDHEGQRPRVRGPLDGASGGQWRRVGRGRRRRRRRGRAQLDAPAVRLPSGARRARGSGLDQLVEHVAALVAADGHLGADVGAHDEVENGVQLQHEGARRRCGCVRRVLRTGVPPGAGAGVARRTSTM